MALADYQPETREVTLKGTSFTVRGLSLEDFTKLVRTHLSDMEAVFELGSGVIKGKTELDSDDLMTLAIAFAEQAPGFVANLIAMAAGESDNPAVIDKALTLSMSIQVKVLIDIAELTFDEVGGIKKALESVAGLLKKGKTPVIPQPQTDR